MGDVDDRILNLSWTARVGLPPEPHKRARHDRPQTR